MKRSFMLLSGAIMMMLANFASAAPVPNESLDYTLNSSRSTWLIRSGAGTAKIMEYRPESEHGPGYVVRINYDINVMLRGRQTGELDIFVPEKVFNQEQFLADLAANHPMSLGSFKLDYEGVGEARDARGTLYTPCAKTRVFDVNPMYRPMNPGEAMVLRFDHDGSIKSVSGLQIKMKLAAGVPILGAVQLDVSGVSDQGIGFEIGMDMVPPGR